MNTITSASSFDRANISARQIKRANPEEGPKLVDTLGLSSTVGGMHWELTRRTGVAEQQRNAMGYALAGAGVAALAVGTLLNPLGGLAVAGIAGLFFGPGAIGGQLEINHNRAQGRKLDELAERTEKALVTTEANGTVTDRRFVDMGNLHDPVEVSRNGEVVARSVRYEMDQGRSVSVSADVKAGNVTLKGPEGESTFPGTLILPTWENPSIIVTRDEAVAGYPKSELEMDQGQGITLDMLDADGSEVGRGNHWGNGAQIVTFSDDGSKAVAIQSPVQSWHLTGDCDDERPDLREVQVNDATTVTQRMDLPELEPLQAADMTGRIHVVGAHFHPRGGGEFEMKYDEQAGLVKISAPETGPSTVRGELTKDGRIVMLQDSGLLVAQSFSDTTVRLHVKDRDKEFDIYQRPSDVPYARNDQGTLDVRTNGDQSYTVQTAAGEVRVAPALTSWQLSERGQPSRATESRPESD